MAPATDAVETAMSIGTRSPACSELSLAAAEPLSATATHATDWLVLEVPGGWPRDVGDEGALPQRAHEALTAWRDGGAGGTPRRVLFVRRPGRTADALLAFRVVATEARREVRRIELESHEALAGVSLDTVGERVSTSLVLVCGHGSRDRCCASAGTAVLGALADTLDEEALWISSHQGGHRFAANVLVLPAGIQLGRVDPAGARDVVGSALADVIDLAHYRGRTCLAPAAQAAEHAIRAATGLTAVGDLRLATLDANGARASFRDVHGGVHAAVVERAAGPSVPASCGAQARPQPRLEATVVGG